MSNRIFDALIQGIAKGAAEGIAEDLGPRPRPDDPRRFRVYETEETRVDTEGSMIAWGTMFTGGTSVVMFNPDAFPEEDQLETLNLSMYGCKSDVEQATGGKVVFIDE